MDGKNNFKDILRSAFIVFFLAIGSSGLFVLFVLLITKVMAICK